jgi:hypothetical protein
MRRSTIICLLFLLFFSFGFRLRTASTSDGTSRIYLYGSTLVRAVPGSEISIYDISNPAAPVKKSRIAIEGNNDIAVESHYMYVDNYYDMVIYDITDLAQPVALDTLHSVYSTLPSYWFPSEGVDVVQTGSTGCRSCFESQDAVSAPAPASSGDRGTLGQAGSAARFAIDGNYLYCIDGSNLRVFDISEPARPQFKSNSPVGWNIETIFPYENKLFIGGARGMYIYSLSNPDLPSPLGEFEHARSCDPVVAEGNRAYVTLRSGSPCGDNGDQLDIIDISDINKPRLIKTVPMTEPYGLGVKNKNVVVCDGRNGIVILDANDENNVRKIGSIGDITPHDVIINGNVMIVTADSGVFLYDITNIASPTLYNKMVF